MPINIPDLAQNVTEMALKNGADYADVMLFESQGRHIEIREGQLVESEDEHDLSIGLRVFIGTAQAHLSGNDLSKDALHTMVETGIAMAKKVPGDADSMPADPDQIYAHNQAAQDALEVFDPTPLMQQSQLIDYAMRAEAEGMKNPAITRSDGCNISHSHSLMHLHSSHGFTTHRRRSALSASAVFIGGEGEHKERDYAYDQACYLNDLKSAESIGAIAAKRTAKRLNPKQGKTGEFPVIFDPYMAVTLLRNFARAINGASIVRGTSFLKDALHTNIFNPAITITDDPHRKRGLKSSLCDGEGLATQPLTLVEGGVLNHFILDLRSARKLGMQANGCGRRGLASAPSPGSSNLYIEAGTSSVDDMIADIKDGFYVTELMGSQISMTTGDYSRGASGFWIENGQITQPVSQMTIAGNLKQIFMDMIPADDLELRLSAESPSLMIRKMACASA